MASALPAGKRVAAVVVAAGQGLRAGQPVPKQFALWRGKPLVRHSAEALAGYGCAPIVVAIPAGGTDVAARALTGVPGVRLVTGGETRQLSVRSALSALEDDAPELVLIHDAARPGLGAGVLDRLLAALDVHRGVIPVLPILDSVTYAENDAMGAPADRSTLRRVQTPQAFDYSSILAAHRAWTDEPNAGDDAQVAQAAGVEVALVEGDEALHKVTYADDFRAVPALRVGTGYDVHRLAEGEELWLCGVKLDHFSGLEGHSDADVAIHALVDALLGAIGAEDIGAHFPPSDPQWRGASSDRFLAHAHELVRGAGYRIGNLDVTIVCEAPRIGPHRQEMRQRLAGILGIDPSQVSVKATTTEGVGFTGRREAIAAQAVATVVSL